MRVEPLDDLPVLGSKLLESGLSTYLDKHFPDHGHWQGISGGKLAIGWLLYILSECDHRLSHVESWASLRIKSLGAILGEVNLRVLDFSDDRLGRLLDRYSDDKSWNEFEQSFGRKVLEVYDLVSDTGSEIGGMHIIRSDSFNAPQFREVSELFTYGHSKQRRSDQPFCKVMLAALDPMALPISVEIIKGGGPDVEHYLTVINRVQSILGQSGNLYVGDSQLGSLANRLAIEQAGDYYLTPLNLKQCTAQELYKYLDQLPQPIEKLAAIFTDADSTRKPAYYYELAQEVSIEVNEYKWKERRILVYSPAYAQRLLSSYKRRLDEAETAIQNLVISKKGRRNPRKLADLYARVDGLIKQFKVQEAFEINCSQTVEKYRVQRHKDRPEEIREKITLHLEINRNEPVIIQKQQRMGWQLYATNAPVEKVSTTQAVICYRNEYRIEHVFDYIINRDTGLLPIFLKKETRVKALIRLLSLAMRFSILIQNQVRGQLAKNDQQLGGIYPGNKNRKTRNPTTSMILRAFRGIAVVWMEIADQKLLQMTELNQTQKIILDLLNDKYIYSSILHLLKSYPSLRET